MATAVVAIGSAVAAGAAGAAATTAYGLVAGVMAGALVGGVVSAVGTVITGGDIKKGFLTGALTGALAGGLSGYAAQSANAADAANTVASVNAVDTGTTQGMLTSSIGDTSGAIVGNGATTGIIETAPTLGGEMNLASLKDFGVIEGSGSGVNKMIGAEAGKQIAETGSRKLLSAATETVGAGVDKAKGLLSGMSDFQKMAALQVGGNAMAGIAEQKSQKEILEAKQKEEEEARKRRGNFTQLDLSHIGVPALRRRITS